MKLNITVFIIICLFFNSSQKPFTTTTTISYDSNKYNINNNNFNTKLNPNFTRRLNKSTHESQLTIIDLSLTPSNDGNKNEVNNFPQPSTLTLSHSEQKKTNDMDFYNINSYKDTVIFLNETKQLNNYTKEEKLCFSENRVFFNESCQELLYKGICDDGQWLVLDLQSALLTPPKIIPKCEKRYCETHQFYWLQTRTCYDDNNNISKYSLCPYGNEITTDYFGYGNCECKPTYGLYHNGTCFELYTQGPCSKGFIFIENDNKITECIQNPCKNISLIPWESGDKQCHLLGEQGPCENHFSFQVSQKTRKPDCVGQIASLTVFGGPQICVPDGKKGCKSEFKLKEQGKDYIEKIIAQSQKRKG